MGQWQGMARGYWKIPYLSWRGWAITHWCLEAKPTDEGGIAQPRRISRVFPNTSKPCLCHWHCDIRKKKQISKILNYNFQNPFTKTDLIHWIYFMQILYNDWILCVWQGRIGEYHLNSEKLWFNIDRRPKAGGLYWTSISKNEDGIPQYVQARRTVFTLLLNN